MLHLLTKSQLGYQYKFHNKESSSFRIELTADNVSKHIQYSHARVAIDHFALIKYKCRTLNMPSKCICVTRITFGANRDMRCAQHLVGGA